MLKSLHYSERDNIISIFFYNTALIEDIIVGKKNSRNTGAMQTINYLKDFGNILLLLSLSDKLGFHGLIYCFVQYSLQVEIRKSKSASID